MNALEVTERVLRACGRPDLEPEILATAGHEIQDQFLDSTKARAVLEWAPRHGFDEGMERTVDWYRERLCGSNAGAAASAPGTASAAPS